MMIRRLSLCLALAALPAFAAAKPRPRPKPAAKAGPVVLKVDADVPLPGSAAELLDPASQRGRAVAALPESLADFQATRFADGRVLITGGTLRGPASQWFDPVSRSFSPGPAMTQIRQGHKALLLKDGRLLLVGGTETPAPAEVLSPGATRFQPVPGEARFGLSAEAVELDEGKVFLADGGSGQLFTWDGRKSVRSQGSLARPRILFRALRLADGRVAITGGWPSETRPKAKTGRGPARSLDTGPSLPIECFNPRWSTLSSWKPLPRARARHQASLLADGRVCLWAGFGADSESTCAAMEILDPVKETVTLAGDLPAALGAFPGWIVAEGKGLFLAENGQELRTLSDPLELLKPVPGVPAGRLANAYLAPTLVALGNGGVLVLGAPAWGVPMDRWDPRSQQCAVLGSLRAGAAGLGLTADGKVLVLGPVVDLLDPRSGALKPLGWREDLAELMKGVRPAEALAPARPPFGRGQERRDFLVVPLDKARALVIGGALEGVEVPPGSLDLWDQKKKSLSPAGTMKTRRRFPAGPEGPFRGAAKLGDGSVLIWGPGLEQGAFE
jgi:hypothetical protein